MENKSEKAVVEAMTKDSAKAHRMSMFFFGFSCFSLGAMAMLIAGFMYLDHIRTLERGIRQPPATGLPYCKERPEQPKRLEAESGPTSKQRTPLSGGRIPGAEQRKQP